ncbi:MAG TPA: DUF86 domain-containing protein [Anaeromyxobacter sp.]
MSPGTLDPTLVRRHLAALDRAVQQLRRHAGKSPDALKDLDEAWAIERGLQICVQNCLDVATHLAAAAGRDVPDYATAVDRLEELGVLPGAFARRFRSVAGFRNVLVHGYLEVDPALVHRVLNERLDDFEMFARHVLDRLDRP